MAKILEFPHISSKPPAPAATPQTISPHRVAEQAHMYRKMCGDFVGQLRKNQLRTHVQISQFINWSEEQYLSFERGESAFYESEFQSLCEFLDADQEKLHFLNNLGDLLKKQSYPIELGSGALKEHEKLRILCHHHNVHPAESSLFERIGNDVAWEIVDFDLNQLYRSELIHKVTNYSIDDYESHSPWELFSRPQPILELLINKTMDVKREKSLIHMDDIPSYVMEETKTAAKAQFKIKHFFVCPLIGRTNNEISMFISTFGVEPLDPVKRITIL